jgi:hypothetical protein
MGECLAGMIIHNANYSQIDAEEGREGDEKIDPQIFIQRQTQDSCDNLAW